MDCIKSETNPHDLRFPAGTFWSVITKAGISQLSFLFFRSIGIVGCRFRTCLIYQGEGGATPATPEKIRLLEEVGGLGPHLQGG